MRRMHSGGRDVGSRTSFDRGQRSRPSIRIAALSGVAMTIVSAVMFAGLTPAAADETTERSMSASARPNGCCRRVHTARHATVPASRSHMTNHSG